MAEGFQSVRADDSGHDAGQELWYSCIDQLAQEMPEQQFNTWIRPLAAVVAADFSKVTVLVGNRKISGVHRIKIRHGMSGC